MKNTSETFIRGVLVLVLGFSVALSTRSGGAKAEGECPGRMTGGGSVFTTDGTRVTHGFELHCTITAGPNNLEVNWDKGNNFHLESMISARCSDDPNIDPGMPESAIDTYRGMGTGRYNGVSGATAKWVITDAGEPGKSDTFQIRIWDADGILVLSVSGNLNSGNQQAHHHDG